MQLVNGVSSSAVTNIREQNYTISRQKIDTEPVSTSLKEGEGIWCQLGREYDIRDITTQERAELSQKLYDAGEITLLDHAILSFDGDRNLPEGSTFLTEKASGGGYDLIAEFSARIDLNARMGETQSLENNQRVLDILNHLQTARNEPIDIVA